MRDINILDVVYFVLCLAMLRACLFRLFFMSFSENLVVGRIWLWPCGGESEYRGDYVRRNTKGYIVFRI
jgi:hypothetical protein